MQDNIVLCMKSHLYLVFVSIGIGDFAKTETEPKHDLPETEYLATDMYFGRSLVTSKPEKNLNETNS